MRNLIFILTILIGCLGWSQTYIKGPALVETPTIVATAGGTTTLTKDSNTIQNFTGVTTQTVQLPDATTLPVGRYFEIYNDSTGAVTVNDNGSNVVHTVRPSTSIKIIVKDVSTSNGVWIIQKIDNNLPPLSAGKYLTNNGTSTSWADVDALPAQAGNAGKYLTTDGTSTSWADVDALPAQAGNTGKYLTTDGTSTSWDTLTLQTTYLASTQPQITLNSTQSGMQIRDASTPIGSTLFAIQNNAGSTNYLGVGVNGLSTTNFVGTGTTGAVRVHNLTTAQKNSLTAANGMIVYDTDLSQMQCYVGGSWGQCVRDLQSSDLTLTASDTIAISLTHYNQTWLVQGSSAAITMSTIPFGSTAPVNGAEITIIGNHDTNTVTFVTNDAAKGIMGYGMTLGKFQTVTFKYNATLDRYVIKSTSN